MKLCERTRSIIDTNERTIRTNHLNERIELAHSMNEFERFVSNEQRIN